jgi:hypothetical protein
MNIKLCRNVTRELNAHSVASVIFEPYNGPVTRIHHEHVFDMDVIVHKDKKDDFDTTVRKVSAMCNEDEQGLLLAHVSTWGYEHEVSCNNVSGIDSGVRALSTHGAETDLIIIHDNSLSYLLADQMNWQRLQPHHMVAVIEKGYYGFLDHKRIYVNSLRPYSLGSTDKSIYLFATDMGTFERTSIKYSFNITSQELCLRYKLRIRAFRHKCMEVKQVPINPTY